MTVALDFLDEIVNVQWAQAYVLIVGEASEYQPPHVFKSTVSALYVRLGGGAPVLSPKAELFPSTGQQPANNVIGLSIDSKGNAAVSCQGAAPPTPLKALYFDAAGKPLAPFLPDPKLTHAGPGFSTLFADGTFLNIDNTQSPPVVQKLTPTGGLVWEFPAPRVGTGPSIFLDAATLGAFTVATYRLVNDTPPIPDGDFGSQKRRNHIFVLGPNGNMLSDTEWGVAYELSIPVPSGFVATFSYGDILAMAHRPSTAQNG